MSNVNILVPDLPESAADATVATWHKKPGDVVVRDEVLVETETDKVVLEVPVSTDGTLDVALEGEGTIVLPRQTLGRLREGNSAGEKANERAGAKASTPAQCQQVSPEGQNNDALSPAIRRLLVEHNLDAAVIKGTGVGGRLTREDVERHLVKAPVAAEARVPATTAAATPAPQLGHHSGKRVPMTHLRKRVAERLLEVKNSTAMLMTFNEVNMKPIMDLRKQYSDAFEKRYGIRLGSISFYVKAAAETLKRYPETNAPIDDDDVVYRNYFDVSMAAPAPRGLVAPALHDADLLSMVDIEKNIKELAVKGRDDKLTIDDLTGGNFTITSGGVFGSLMSMPIINSPQSAILGMHAIKDRPMAVNGKVEILLMMYLALSYDHRLINGRESVGFLVATKESLEDPTCLLSDV